MVPALKASSRAATTWSVSTASQMTRVSITDCPFVVHVGHVGWTADDRAVAVSGGAPLGEVRFGGAWLRRRRCCRALLAGTVVARRPVDGRFTVVRVGGRSRGPGGQEPWADRAAGPLTVGRGVRKAAGPTPAPATARRSRSANGAFVVSGPGGGSGGGRELEKTRARYGLLAVVVSNVAIAMVAIFGLWRQASHPVGPHGACTGPPGVILKL